MAEKPTKPEVKKTASAKPEKKTSRVIEILKTEYPFEGILLGILGILVFLLGVYIFEAEVLQIRFTDFWLFDSPLKIQIFSSVVMVIGAGAIIMAFAPFFIPGLKEMNRVSWPNRRTMVNHTSRVLGFMAFVGVMFVLYDIVLRPFFRWIESL
ncbi:MAG: preprotein translocase subunit SecE [Acholeplasmatales bacterium]|nr:MAG: preprotein translocase subunit SecE [Acholeplasmatales bacterium]